MKVVDLLRLIGGRTKLRILDDRYEYLPLFVGCLDENFEQFGGKDVTFDKENSVVKIPYPDSDEDMSINLHELEVKSATVINGEDVLTISVDVAPVVKSGDSYLDFIKSRAIKRRWLKKGE